MTREQGFGNSEVNYGHVGENQNAVILFINNISSNNNAGYKEIM